MTTQASPLPDVFMTWKDLYDRTEKLWTKPLHEMLGTETAARLMSLTRENALTQQQHSREALESYWEALRLPTKTDHARLAGQVVALEAKVEGVEDRLESIENKLDALTSRLELLLDAGSPDEKTENGKRRRQ